jgi:hypothetical protein
MKSIHEIKNQISACAEMRAARRLGLWSMLVAPLIVLAFVANAHATVRCVSPSGTVPPGQAKKAGCSATISKTIGGAIAAAAAGDTVFVFDRFCVVPAKPRLCPALDATLRPQRVTE